MEHDASPADPRGVATGIAAAIEAVRAHRQRMATLVDGLDDLGRRRAQTADVRSARVIETLTDVLRAGDRQLDQLSSELERGSH
jgi:hypothetical protein